MNKHLFALIGLGIFCGYQAIAWLLGHNGQVTTLCSSGIAAVIAYVVGFGHQKVKSKTKTEQTEE